MENNVYYEKIKEEMNELREIYKEYDDDEYLFQKVQDMKYVKVVRTFSKTTNPCLYSEINEIIDKEWRLCRNLKDMIKEIIKKILYTKLSEERMTEYILFVRIYYLYYYIDEIKEKLLVKTKINETRFLYYHIDDLINQLKEFL